MVSQDLIENSTYKGIAVYLRHNPENRSILLELTKEIQNNHELNNNELVYLIKNNLKELPTCICGKPLKYVKPTVGYRSSCGDKTCVNTISSKKRINTNNIKYGGNSPANSKDVLEKMKNTIKEKYGVDSVNKIPNVRERIIQTNLKKYGTEWSSQSKEIKEKSKNNLLDKYGVDCTQKIDSVKEKTTKTNIKKWGVKEFFSSKEIREKIYKTFDNNYGGHPMRNEKIKEKVRETNLNRWGETSPTKNKKIRDKIGSSNFNAWLNKIGLDDKNFIKKDDDGYYIVHCETEGKEFKIHPVTYNRRKRNSELISTYLNPLTKNYSKGEKELLEYIKTIYNGEVIPNDRSVLDGKELDIFIPELNLAFEYNGLYFHSDNFKPKRYHQNKFIKSSQNGVKLIQIWEDEWFNEEKKIKSYLNHVFGKTTNRIYGRKCDVKFISVNEYKDFCDVNHLQGYARSKHKIGLYFNDELVSVMSFCSPRVKSKKNIEFEMVRYCNKLNTTIIGGGSKMFSFFTKNIKPNSIISYSDLDKFNSSFYGGLGFILDGVTEPGFFYFDGLERFSRFSLRKGKISSKNININSYDKVFNSGNNRWLWFNPIIPIHLQ